MEAMSEIYRYTGKEHRSVTHKSKEGSGISFLLGTKRINEKGQLTRNILLI